MGNGLGCVVLNVPGTEPLKGFGDNDPVTNLGYQSVVPPDMVMEYLECGEGLAAHGALVVLLMPLSVPRDLNISKAIHCNKSKQK